MDGQPVVYKQLRKKKKKVSNEADIVKFRCTYILVIPLFLFTNPNQNHTNNHLESHGIMCSKSGLQL